MARWFFLFLLVLVPATWGQMVPSFVHSGRAINDTTRLLTFLDEGPLALIHKGSADAPPIFRVVTAGDESKISDGVFPSGKVRYIFRRFGDWSYLAVGDTLDQKNIRYSLFTSGERQLVFRGFVTAEGTPAYTLLRERNRVFIIQGGEAETQFVKYTLTETIDRDFLQSGYQTGGQLIDNTLDKKPGIFYLHGGFITDPETTLFTLFPELPDGLKGLAVLFSKEGEMVPQRQAIPFFLATRSVGPLRRETLIALYLLEKNR